MIRIFSTEDGERFLVALDAEGIVQGGAQVLPDELKHLKDGWYSDNLNAIQEPPDYEIEE